MCVSFYRSKCNRSKAGAHHNAFCRPARSKARSFDHAQDDRNVWSLCSLSVTEQDPPTRLKVTRIYAFFDYGYDCLYIVNNVASQSQKWNHTIFYRPDRSRTTLFSVFLSEVEGSYTLNSKFIRHQ